MATKFCGLKLWNTTAINCMHLQCTRHSPLSPFHTWITGLGYRIVPYEERRVLCIHCLCIHWISLATHHRAYGNNNNNMVPLIFLEPLLYTCTDSAYQVLSFLDIRTGNEATLQLVMMLLWMHVACIICYWQSAHDTQHVPIIQANNIIMVWQQQKSNYILVHCLCSKEVFFVRYDLYIAGRVEISFRICLVCLQLKHKISHS